MENANLKMKILGSITTVAAFLMAGPFMAYAVGNLSLEGPKQVNRGEGFVLHVSANVGDQSVNALSSTLTVGPGLSIKQVLDGDSFISLWIQAPTVSHGADGDSVTFAGIVPGGFMNKQKLMDVVLTAKDPGSWPVKVSELEMRANDKDATNVPVNLSTLTISVSNQTGTSTVTIADSIPPEPFGVIVSSNPNAFDGKPFASFSTTDKQSGIDHYEVAYAYLFKPGDKSSAWKTVTSPYELEQTGKLLFVKAVDHAGNVRIEGVVTPGYSTRFIIVLVLVIIVLVLIWGRRSRSKRGLNRSL